MIDLCTVIINGNTTYLKTLLNSIAWHKSKIDKIIVADLYGSEIYEKNYKFKNLNVFQFNYTFPHTYTGSIGNNDYGHALGLHACLDKSESEYVLFSDPDVYFKTNVVKIYYNYLNQGFDLVGMNNYKKIATINAYGQFPTVINMMCRRNWLPPMSFLKNKLFVRNNWALSKKKYIKNEKDIKVNGKYLVQGFIKGVAKEFPNPNGIFDVGCNLWLWCKRNNSNWLCFDDEMYYSNKSNFEPISLKPLIVHKTHGSTKNKSLDLANKFYQEFLLSVKNKIKLA